MSATAIESLHEELGRVTADGLAALAAAATPAAVEEVRVRTLGRKGTVSAAMKLLGSLTPEGRPAAGKVINEAKDRLTAAIEARLAALAAAAAPAAPAVDVTLPGRRHPLGLAHPISRTMDECVEVFRRMGFTVASGPDLEDEFHNFDALNTPADHPSRDIQDTLYLDGGRLLRTHTSPVQVRVMERRRPPVRIVAPGRCYRRDTQDATHSLNFHQIEGLYVDHGVSLADLKGTLLAFAQEVFGAETRIRLRPHFFPFTEPSLEGDVFFRGKWLELFGAGMVNPAVLAKVGYDAEEWTGFAFGMGIERIAMIKYGIPDLRLLYENNLDFLRQF